MNKICRKVISVVLCLSLLLSMGMVSAFATDGTAVERVSCVVNGDTASQRGFTWYTEAETATEIKIFKNAVADVTDTLTLSNVKCEEWEGHYMHQVTVSGLEAGTLYTYVVGDGNVWSDVGTFTTDDGDDKINFITIADVQASSEENFEKASYVMEAAAKMMPNADFVANLGDYTNDSTNEEWDAYFKYFQKYNNMATHVPVAGNHDGLGVWHWFENMFALDTSESVQNLNGVNYSFDYGNVHFAVLNTNDLIAISNAQLNWLRNDMNSTDADWKIVLMHKSPYTLGKDGKWPDALYLSEALTNVLDECNVDVVMSGHDHQYLRTKSLYDNAVAEDGNGTTYILAGTAGTKRYEVREFMPGTYMQTEFIDALTIQKNGYGNYWDGEDWDQTDPERIGGVFSTMSIDGGELKFEAYVVNDETQELKLIDEMTITKETGENEATFEGDNSTSTFEYALDVVPSFLSLAAYAIGNWLIKTVFNLPKILYYVIKTDTF
ncbi:MAG: metallophosphoesterase family protein [Clostridia bacterium]|nr:metallophosphoesterase family protein [Clostridia bacterium]